MTAADKLVNLELTPDQLALLQKTLNTRIPYNTTKEELINQIFETTLALYKSNKTKKKMNNE